MKFLTVITITCARGKVVILCVSMCVSVCVCICYHASYYIPGLYVENKVLLGFLWYSHGMHCVDFVENASFKSLGDICWLSFQICNIAIAVAMHQGFCTIVLHIPSSYIVVMAHVVKGPQYEG